MRIRRIGPIAIATACILFAGTALADDELTRKGYYIAAGGNYGFSMVDGSPLAALIQTPLSNENSWGMNVRAGNRLKSWLAVEIQYEWMAGFDLNQSTASISAPFPAAVAAYRPDIVTVNAKFFLPVWRTQPYLLVGGGLASYDVDFFNALATLSRSSNGFAFRAGAGVDAYLTKHLLFFAEGSYVINTDSTTIPLSPTGETNTVTDLYYVSVTAGLAIRF